MKEVALPLTSQVIASLSAGDEVLLSGVVYTARDRVHRIIFEEIVSAQKKRRKDLSLPFPLAGQTIYYCGPTPTPPGRIIGSAGPTTSSRMDNYTPLLLRYGLKGMIGKGSRNVVVRQAIARYGAVYFVTYGGCGVLLASHIKEAKIVAFPELGPEAVWRLLLVDFPAVVGIDCKGKVFPDGS